MQHPFSIAVTAASATVLAAAVRAAMPALMFLSFGFLCFALAVLVHDEAVGSALKQASWVAVGLIQLVAYLAFRYAHPAQAVPTPLLIFGLTYLVLGTAFWAHARSS